ncbi:hypothetical protein EDC94DRAFT_649420 [Helicostylum pulchrum]|nr:hypothetical protein EDC94DRAFT_649420 [Helicostylum pulchrum]
MTSLSSNNATSINIICYTLISERLTVSLTNWEKAVADYIPLHGVRFVKGTTRTAEEQERAQAQRLNATKGPKPRTRYIDYVFKTYYFCHHSGEKRHAKTEQNNSSEGSRNLVATCYKSDPNNVVLYHSGNHNHQIAGLEDPKFLPLSQVAKQLNEQILCKGFRKRDTRISIQNNFLRHSQANFNIDVEQSLGNKAQVIVHRDQMVHSTEKKAQDPKDSVKLWLTQLKKVILWSQSALCFKISVSRLIVTVEDVTNCALFKALIKSSLLVVRIEFLLMYILDIRCERLLIKACGRF